MPAGRDPETGRFVSGGGGLGGASFVLSVDTSGFDGAMDAAEKKAEGMSYAVEKSVERVAVAYKKLSTDVYDVGEGFGANAIKIQAASDRQVAASVAAMQRERAIRQALTESSVASMGSGAVVAKAGAAGEKVGKAFGGGAAMGLLQLGQAVDDAQYGFRAIVNNIPTIAMAMTGSAGIAGAVGIAAVAVSQLINHWTELSAVLSNTEGWRVAEQGVKALVAALESGKDAPEVFAAKMALIPAPGGLGPALKGFGAVARGTEADRKLAAGKAADLAAGEKLFGGANDAEVDKEKAVDFKKAIEESGGLKAVLDHALKEAMKAPGAVEAEQKGRLAKVFAEGMKGGDFDPDAFGANFGKRFDAQGKQREEARIAKEEKETADARKAADATLTRALSEQGQQIEKEMWAEQAKKVHDMEVEKDALRKREQFVQGQIQDRPHFGTFGSVGDMIKSMSEERFNRVPTQQLQELKNIKGAIEDMNDEIKKARGAKFG